MRDTFSAYHPLVSFLYFLLVLLFTMFWLHPVCLAISFLGAYSYALYLNGKKALRLSLMLLPLLVITMLINPLFSHEGATILTYLPGGNPLTLESIVYGAAAALMLISVMGWFSCYQAVMTSDKFVYLFGRVIPALSLLFSMVLRFVPRFSAQFKVVANAQKSLGRDVSKGNLFSKMKHGVTLLSVMTTWMLENAIDTADSMKSRGYGLKGRTAFSLYIFGRRDRICLAAEGLLGILLIIGWRLGLLRFRFFPTLKGAGLSTWSAGLTVLYAVLSFLPLALNLWEDLQWKRLQSGI